MHQQGRGCSGKLLIEALERQGKLKRQQTRPLTEGVQPLLVAICQQLTTNTTVRGFAFLHRCYALCLAECALHPARGNLFSLSSLDPSSLFF